MGDLVAAVLALVALRREWSAATGLVWVFNIVGTVDLLFAVTQGTRYSQSTLMGATYFIPAFAVPLLLVSHWLIFRRLRVTAR